jgi:uncharacterized membrane protein YhhN
MNALGRLLPVEHRRILLAFLGIGLLDVVGEMVHLDVLANLAKPLLIPALLWWVLAVRRAAAPRLLVVGLVLAWLGDLALMLPGDTAFIVGLLLFLGMQVCYARGFVTLGAVGALRSAPWLPAVGIALWIGLNVALGPSLGSLRLPLLVYSAALTTMAVLACGVSLRVGSPRAGIGGVTFLVSDLLIGLDAAGIGVPLHGPLVMATYVVGQLLIATGWIAAESRDTTGSSAAVATRVS